MKLKSITPTQWLILLFMVIFTSRVYFSFQTAQFSDSESYYSLRQIEHIEEKGYVFFTDDYSFSGRYLPTLPFFYYLMFPFIAFFGTTLAAKLFLNLIATSSILIVYLLVKFITNRISLALFTSFISGFIPIYYANTLNTITPTVLFIPLLLSFI